MALAREVDMPLEHLKAAEFIKSNKELLRLCSFGIDMQRCSPYRSEAWFYELCHDIKKP